MKIEYIFTKKKDDFCNNKAGFIDYLKSNVRISFSDNFITIDKKKFSYKLSENTVEKTNEIDAVVLDVTRYKESSHYEEELKYRVYIRREGNSLTKEYRY